MKKISLVLMMMATFVVTKTFAQSDASSTSAVAKRGLSLSIGAEGVLPVGTFKDAGYKFGGGGSAKLAIPVASMLDVTISAGYIVFGASKLEELNDAGAYAFIPFKGGLKLRTSPGFYVEPQAGYTQTKLQNVSEGEGEFTYALNLGYLIGNAVDVAARYEAVATKGTSAKMIGLRLAYNIPFARTK